jgi:hypothetical protein
LWNVLWLCRANLIKMLSVGLGDIRRVYFHFLKCVWLLNLYYLFTGYKIDLFILIVLSPDAFKSLFKWNIETWYDIYYEENSEEFLEMIFYFRKIMYNEIVSNDCL